MRSSLRAFNSAFKYKCRTYQLRHINKYKLKENQYIFKTIYHTALSQIYTFILSFLFCKITRLKFLKIPIFKIQQPNKVKKT